MNSFRYKNWYPWLEVGLLWVGALLNYMDRQMLSTMRESMSVDITDLESTIMFGKVMSALCGFMDCAALSRA